MQPLTRAHNNHTGPDEQPDASGAYTSLVIDGRGLQLFVRHWPAPRGAPPAGMVLLSHGYMGCVRTDGPACPAMFCGVHAPVHVSCQLAGAWGQALLILPWFALCFRLLTTAVSWQAEQQPAAAAALRLQSSHTPSCAR